MSVVTESKTARKWAMPDTLVIIFCRHFNQYRHLGRPRWDV